MGLGMWMTPCPEAMGWGFGYLKKRISWDSTLEEGSRFLIWARPDQGSTGWLHIGWVSELRADDVRTVSIIRNYVFLFLMLKNLKFKKVNKSFVPQPISCFQIPICIHVWTLWMFYACEYLSRIFGRGYVTLAYTEILQNLWLALVVSRSNFWNPGRYVYKAYLHTLSPFRFDLVSLFNGISTFMGNLMPKPSL